MNIHTIDLQFRGVPNAVAVFVVQSGDDVVLIETGPSSTLPTCLAGLAELGIRPKDVGHVLLSHIHFDHAGAAGWWAEQGAQIYLHELGAPHLVDPSRLVASATRLYGDQMDTLWGEIRPIPEAKATSLADGDVIEIGALRFEAWNTPGHAFHHHAFVLGDVVFTGDVAGVRLPNQTHLSLAGAPPQFDLTAYDQSLLRLLAGNFRQAYLTHFGVVQEVQDHLIRYREVLFGSAELVRAHLRNEAPREALHTHYALYEYERAQRHGVSSAVWEQYQVANPVGLSADGLALYWQKKGWKTNSV